MPTNPGTALNGRSYPHQPSGALLPARNLHMVTPLSLGPLGEGVLLVPTWQSKRWQQRGSKRLPSNRASDWQSQDSHPHFLPSRPHAEPADRAPPPLGIFYSLLTTKRAGPPRPPGSMGPSVIRLYLQPHLTNTLFSVYPHSGCSNLCAPALPPTPLLLLGLQVPLWGLFPPEL